MGIIPGRLKSGGRDVMVHPVRTVNVGRWRSNDGTGAQQEMDGSRVVLLNKRCRGLGIKYGLRGGKRLQSEITGST